MEYASYLAGAKWSDHPACTHPLLAELARQVNDFTSDETRQTFVEVVPDLIGLTGSDLRYDVLIALRAARIALPVVDESRQHMMAAAVLTCERVLADLDGSPGAPMTPQSREALDRAPLAAAWARRFTRNMSVSHRVFRRNAAPTIVRFAVQGVAHACIADPDSLLRDMLVGAIADCKALRAQTVGADHSDGQRAPRLLAAALRDEAFHPPVGYQPHDRDRGEQTDTDPDVDGGCADADDVDHRRQLALDVRTQGASQL